MDGEGQETVMVDSNLEQRRAGRLHGVECPEPAGEGVVAAGHRPARAVLADGSHDASFAPPDTRLSVCAP